jgi:hypothetical protein
VARILYLLVVILGASALVACSGDCEGRSAGCRCDPVKDVPFCEGWSDPSVGFTCIDGRWSTGPDGPCMHAWDGGRPSTDAPIDAATPADLATSESRTTPVDSTATIDVVESFDGEGRDGASSR